MNYKEDWAPKNWYFWTVVLEKPLESPLDNKEIKPVHPKGNPEYSLEGLMLKLKLQYFGHLMQRADSLEKTLMLGKIEGRRRGQQGQDGWMASLTQGTWVWASSRRWLRIGKTGMLQSRGHKESDTIKRLNYNKDWKIRIEKTVTLYKTKTSINYLPWQFLSDLITFKIKIFLNEISNVLLAFNKNYGDNATLKINI